jgi:hypothetical protein
MFGRVGIDAIVFFSLFGQALTVVVVISSHLSKIGKDRGYW